MRPGTWQRLESWLEAHLDAVALAIVAVGFMLRVKAGIGTYLNPDEATNYLIAHQSSLTGVYRASLTNPHPPLYYFLLLFWRRLGDSEFMLRLPSMLAGTAFLWVAYRWAGRVLGRATGFVMLAVLAVSPLMVSMSGEVRSYPLLLLLICAALLVFEQAFAQKQARLVLIFGLLLVLAVPTHYSALAVTLALGVYGLVRVVRRRESTLGTRYRIVSPFTATWIAVQVFIAGLGLLLYFTHLSHLRGTGMERSAADIWLRGSYFHPGEDNPLLFLIRSTGLAFRYLFDSRLLGIPATLLALTGLALLIARPGPQARRLHALLLGLPFIVAALLALTGLQPYGGSRHNLYLMPFAVGLAGYCLAVLTRRRLAVLVPGLVLLLPVWVLLAPKPGMRIADPRRSVMDAAIAHVRQTIPGGATIFCDFQTSQLLGYYLGRSDFADFPRAVSELGSGDDYVTQSFSRYRVVSPVRYWSFVPEDFGAELRRFKERIRGVEDSSGLVRMVSAGWGPTLCDERNRVFPDFECEQVKTFGDNIAVFAVKPRLRSENLDALADVARQLPVRSGISVPTVLLPSDLFGPDIVPAVQRLGRQVLTYSRFYEGLSAGRARPADFLPALAFWQFNTQEQHVQGFRYMNERESFSAGGYRFTLLALSRDSSAAAYLIESGR